MNKLLRHLVGQGFVCGRLVGTFDHCLGGRFEVLYGCGMISGLQLSGGLVCVCVCVGKLWLSCLFASGWHLVWCC